MSTSYNNTSDIWIEFIRNKENITLKSINTQPVAYRGGSIIFKNVIDSNYAVKIETKIKFCTYSEIKLYPNGDIELENNVNDYSEIPNLDYNYRI